MQLDADVSYAVWKCYSIANSSPGLRPPRLCLELLRQWSPHQPWMTRPPTSSGDSQSQLTFRIRTRARVQIPSMRRRISRPYATFLKAIAAVVQKPRMRLVVPCQALGRSQNCTMQGITGRAVVQKPKMRLVLPCQAWGQSQNCTMQGIAGRALISLLQLDVGCGSSASSATLNIPEGKWRNPPRRNDVSASGSLECLCIRGGLL